LSLTLGLFLHRRPAREPLLPPPISLGALGAPGGANAASAASDGRATMAAPGNNSTPRAVAGAGVGAGSFGGGGGGDDLDSPYAKGGGGDGSGGGGGGGGASTSDIIARHQVSGYCDARDTVAVRQGRVTCESCSPRHPPRGVPVLAASCTTLPTLVNLISLIDIL